MLQTYSLIGGSLPCIKFLITGRISPICSNIMQLVHFYWGCALCFVHILLADIDIFFIFLRESSAKSATYSVYLIKWDMLICDVGQRIQWGKKKKKPKLQTQLFTSILFKVAIFLLLLFLCIKTLIVNWPSLTNCHDLRAQTLTAWPASQNLLSDATLAAVITLLDLAIAELL